MKRRAFIAGLGGAAVWPFRARALGLELLVQNAGNEQDIDRAFAMFAEHKVGGVTFAADAVYNAGRAQLVALAARYKMPTMYFYRAFANAGGLIRLRRL